MVQVILRAPTLRPLIAKWQAKKARIPSVGLLGSVQIAEVTNAALIPANFKGRVAQTVHAEPGPLGGTAIGRVIGVVDKPLFWWYTKGTATWVGKGTYPIDPIRASVLAFYWQRVGERVFFSHVNNPGTAPHEEEYAAFLASFTEEARTTWTLLLGELLRE